MPADRRTTSTPWSHRLRRRSLPFLILAFVGPLTSGCGDPSTPVLAGAATPSFLNGIRLAVAEQRVGEAPVQVDTILVPEGSSRSAPALAVAQDLVALPGLVAVVGHSNSVASLATSQVYNAARVVQIAPSSSASLYSEAGPFSFRMVPPDHEQGAFLAGVVADSLSAGTRLALLFVNDDYGRGLRGAVLDHLDTERHPVVLDLPHTEGDVQPLNVEHTLSALAASQADALLWLGRVPPLSALLPRLRERVGGIPVIGGDAVSRAALPSSPDPSWDGVLYVDFVDMDATPELRDFRRRFQDRFGADASGPEVLAYDAAGLVLAAIGSGARTGEEVRRYLMSLGRARPPYPGVSGPVSFGDSGDMDRGYVLRRIGDLAGMP